MTNLYLSNTMKSQILTPRRTYKPFLYETAYDYWLKQQGAHWLPTEVSMNSDIQDWKLKMTEGEKQVIANVLKGFIQTEITVNEYWSRNVSHWFPHPEIAMMASAFGSFEGIHTIAYAYLNDTLGIEDYDAFLEEPTAFAKLDRLDKLVNVGPIADIEDIARSLAIFSAFTEGVSLFSSFAILLSFSRFNKLKGLGQIISWSIRDETLHSEAGNWLFRTLISENPEIWTDSLKKDIYEAARITVSLEDAFIDRVFGNYEIEGLNAHDMKAFIRHRANLKLGEVGCKMNWKNIDQDALSRMEWFDYMSAGQSHVDFFATRPSDYSKVGADFDDMW